MSDYQRKLRSLGVPIRPTPEHVSLVVRSHCDEAARRFVDDPGRVPRSMRNFLIRATHGRHGGVQELVQVNASRDRIKEVFEEFQTQSGVVLTVLEELVRFKLASPLECEGLTKLIEFAREENLTENYAIEQGVKLLERCRVGYDV